MVPPLILLLLLLSFYVEDSSASTLSLTRIRKNVSSASPKEIEGSEVFTETISFAVAGTALPKDDENITFVYPEKNETVSENYADISDATNGSSPKIPVTEANLISPEGSLSIERQVSVPTVVSELINPIEISGSTESTVFIGTVEPSKELQPIEATVITILKDSNHSESPEPVEDTEDLSSIATTIDPGDSTDGSEPSKESTPDSIESTPDSIESTSDSTPDFTSESTPDSTSDTPDSTSDTTPDSTSDTTPDSTSDTTPDSTSDTTPDSTSNTTLDSTSDTTPDSTSDTTPDITSDSTSDTTPETTSDSIPVTTDSTSDTTKTATTTTPDPDTAESTAPDKDNAVLIAGIIVAILLVGIGVAFLVAYRSGRLRWPPQSLFSSGPMDPIRPQPVTLKKFPAHCTEMLNVPSKLSHEYQLLATLSVDIYATESFVAGQLPDNKSKNRYINILPYDSTRVKLAPEGDDFYRDYVNASYIKGYTNEIEYIATQGPKEDTCRDFWKMVYQEPIKVIVMVTQLEEQGKPKCYKYYPNLRENMELEDIIVRCTTELHFPIYTSRTLILTKGERKRSIIHLHFREWPDFGCPATPDLMLQFCQVMRHNIVLAQPGITLIHCSAGVGRTGTLIAVDILLQHIKENKKIDIFGTVYKLRKHRMNMVQSEAQYVYLYKCIKEALEDPSYLSSENSSTTSLEPIYENVECTRLSTVSSKAIPDTVISENECAL